MAHATETSVSTVARSGKSQAAFRTISEVADELDVAQHVLRFWESKFPQVRPLKRGGGRRYYRPEDIELLRDIRSLLYDEGYTIKGAQKLLRQRRAKPQPPAKSAEAAGPQADLQDPEPDPPSPAVPPATPTTEPASPTESSPAPVEGEGTLDPAAQPPTAAPTSGATSADDVEKLQRLRAELVELRGAVDAALDSADR